MVTGNQAVRRAIAVLKTFDDRNPELGVTEVSRRLDLHKSTVYRLLSAFEDEGLIARNPESGRYRLGPELIVLGELVLRHTEVHRVALPVMRELAAGTGETVDLEILSGANVVTLEVIAGRHLVTAAGAIGRPWAAHATSTGKVLLADLPIERQRRLVQRRLQRFTPHTVTEPDGILRELERVRRAGHAVSRGELEEHLVAVAAPIRGRTGQAVAAVSLSGPDSRFTRAALPALVRHCRAAAERISSRLGCADPPRRRAARPAAAPPPAP
jgi:DNA-binding IclR family transcriptional regulator